MWLIADSGSTKTEWILFNSKKQEKIETSGFNPLFLSEAEFLLKLRKSISKDWESKVSKLWFYGAGCGTDAIKEFTKQCLANVFINANIEVDSDLMAAARATCGPNNGIVTILGTGSNSCYYDGTNITKHIKPLGYILGDEGSGAALGKALLKKLLRNQLSPKLSKSIYQNLAMDYEEIIKKVYEKKWPNRFIASCAKAMHANKNEAEIQSIIKEEFDKFCKILSHYHPAKKVNVVGSVGYYFKNFLEERFIENGFELVSVVSSPINGLVNHHLKKATAN